MHTICCKVVCIVHYMIKFARQAKIILIFHWMLQLKSLSTQAIAFVAAYCLRQKLGFICRLPLFVQG